MRRRDVRRARVLAAALLALVLIVGWGADRGEPDVVARTEARNLRSGDSNPARIYRLTGFDSAVHCATHPVRKGSPLRFAEAVKVEITPDRHGVWETREGAATWRLAVEAPGALNLNFGFSRFSLPASAALEFRTRGGELLVRPFTAADNEAHRELWTPVMAGETIEMVLTVAEEDRPAVELSLGAINRGFRDVSMAAGRLKIGNNGTLGNCHIDVVCTAAESGVGSLIDAYRDQIRAAGAYTLNGTDKCSGAAVNNTRNDGRPLFLTADHCGVRSNNAPSMVVYWNHENSTCRTAGTGANAGNGDGPLTDFNSGAIFRATYAPADATVVELDDPIDPAHNVFQAGWSRTGTPSMSVTVHHPQTSEKRISFDFDAAHSTGDSSDITDPNGTHWRVVDWEFGSTESGSSGAPLFDQDGRIVGQLTAGFAECGNDASDWYGKLGKAWTGGGTSSSRLLDWLDPDGTGATTLDGRNGEVVEVSISGGEVVEGDSGTSLLHFTVELSQAAKQVVDLTYSTRNEDALAGTDYVEAIDAPFSFGVGEVSKQISVEIHGDTEPEEHESLTVVMALVSGPLVSLATPEALGTITNDDFVAPVIVPPGVINGMVAEKVAVVVGAQNTPTTFSLSGAPAGMTIDNGGLITWIPAAAGTFPVMVTAGNPAGSDVETLTFEIGANPLADAIENFGGLAMRTGGAASWSPGSSAEAVRGGNHAQSGLLLDNESSWLELEVDGPDFLGFWWKVSSEEGWDFLNLEVDGELRRRISGSEEWAHVVLATGPGTHLVRWTYQKDSSESEGKDRGWLDFVQSASQDTPFLMESTRIEVVAGMPLDYQFPTFLPGAVFSPRALPDGLAVDAGGGLSGTPSGAGTHAFDLEVEQEGETLVVPATVEVHEDSPLSLVVNQPALAWKTEGDGAGHWYAQATTSRDGQAAKERNVNDDERAEMSTFVFGPGLVSFWWKVSSEEDFDTLSFEIDGIFQDVISGEQDWAPRTFELSYGWHQLTWAYEKDEDLSHGSDTAWIDQVEFSGYTGWAMEAGVGGRTNVQIDGDGDGLNQLFEYATGGSATAWDPMPVPLVVDGVLEWVVQKPAGLSGVHFDAEVSGDLLEWETSTRTIVQDDAELFRARDGFDVSAAGQRFMRGTVHPE